MARSLDGSVPLRAASTLSLSAKVTVRVSAPLHHMVVGCDQSSVSDCWMMMPEPRLSLSCCWVWPKKLCTSCTLMLVMDTMDGMALLHDVGHIRYHGAGRLAQLGGGHILARLLPVLSRHPSHQDVACLEGGAGHQSEDKAGADDPEPLPGSAPSSFSAAPAAAGCCIYSDHPVPDRSSYTGFP